MQYSAVGDLQYLQYPGDVTRSGPAVCQLHYLLPGGVWQGAARHEHSTQLVDAAVTCHMSGELKCVR